MGSTLRNRLAFTLIELLVVVAIIGMLIAILLPTLRTAREASKMTVCGSNLRQLGIGVQAYADENDGFIPRGPEPFPDYPIDFTGNRIATNQVWIGQQPWYPPPNQRKYNGWGQMMESTCPNPDVFYCPADDNFNLAEELPKIKTDEDAYGSYLYRQLDRLPERDERGTLDQMGANRIGEWLVSVEALAMDMNSLGPEPDFRQTNHDAREANVLFRDSSVRRFENRENRLALPPEAFASLPDPTGILQALDQLLTNVDYAYDHGTPFDAPLIDGVP